MATKRMLVDDIHPEETRIVVTIGNRLEEFDFESAQRRQLRGNIYLAKVTRVEPSLQAAFVEYGGNRHGFLAFSEIHPDYYQIPVADREALLRDEEEQDHAEAAEPELSISLPVGVEEPDAEEDTQDMEGAHSHIEQAPSSGADTVESLGGSDTMEEEAPQRRRNHKYKIQEVIKRRQVMLVQVVKEERGNKGAALTTYLSLAGRYSVLMPNTARGGGISRKITNVADRKRLKEITSDLEVPQGMGVILRTAGASRTKAEVKRDFEYLMRLWENVRSLTLKSQAPCLVYEEGSLIKRTIRDLYNKDIDEVFVAGDDAYREAKDFMRMIMPSHAKNVQLYKDDQPLFSKYGIETQLDSMFSPTVTLPSGGYIVINPTEALVSIDVNSGRSTKEHNIEDTALQTNLEASDEVARQLRLRDLAGLIVIDFIDMTENRSNRAVERRLKDALKDDRARIQVGRISHFGLMEMSRQRIRFGVVESSTHKCPICDGTGLVRSVESLALMIMRHIEDHVLRRQGQSINVRIPVEVALYILNFKRETLTALEIRNQLSITITADGKMTGSQFAIEKGEARVIAFADAALTSHVRVDSAVIDDSADDDYVEEDEEEQDDKPVASNVTSTPETGEEEGGEPSRRRRRRRRRGGERGDDNGGPRPAQQRPPQSVQAAPAEGDESEDDGDEEENSARPTDAAETAAEGERKRRRRGRRGGRRNRRDELDGVEKAPSPAGETGLAPDQAEAVAEVLLAQDAIVAEQPEAAAAEPVVAEKPKRSRRKKVEETAESAPAETAPVEAVATEAATAEDEKPKRKRAPRKAKAEASEAAAAESVTAPVAKASAPVEAPAAVVVEAAAPVVEAEKPKRARKELPPEGIVVSSTVAKPETAAEETAEPDKKKKGGWWQRRLGLG
ncbi:MAG: rne [Devosia sp.]|uniref:Rne/Rng family ribonuclease n=1 Tax=Devosia sp. TaxID=1871048 RepID=UPI002616DF80|nr:ribonuclease E/G [Devosia sp.]MDB5529165.1 rne [Devosia sp.]